MDDKHVHEWYTAGTFEGVTVAACGGVGCDAYLESGEIAQRLNATEQLTEQGAFELYLILHGEALKRGAALRAYYMALKDGEE